MINIDCFSRQQIGARIFASVLVLMATSSCISTTDEATPQEQNWPHRDIEFASCLVSISEEARLPLEQVAEEACTEELATPLQLKRSYSNDIMKIYARERYDLPSDSGNEKSFTDLIIAFAGTRNNGGDWFRDIQSQLLIPYTNYYGMDSEQSQRLSNDEEVAAGFNRRWQRQSLLVSAALEELQASHQGKSGHQGKYSIVLAGHSLGAAVAIQGGFDIARTLMDERIEVWAFNPPRVGNSAYALSYVSAIKTCQSVSEGCFMLRQLTRDRDLVHGLPLQMNHPVWNTESSLSLRKNTGFPSSQILDHCAHYHAPSFGTLLENHRLDRWKEDLKTMPEGHFNCLVAP